MKSILTTIVALIFTVSFANAQTKMDSSKMKSHSSSSTVNSQNKDYVTMKNGKLSENKNGTWTPVTTTFTCTDGSKVAPDGTITKTDGTTKMIKEGEKVSKNGKCWPAKSGSTTPKSGSSTPN